MSPTARSLRLVLIVLLTLGAAAGWEDAPADGVLWREDFGDGPSGWTSTWPHRVEVEPGPDGAALRAAASTAGTGVLSRTVVLDLSDGGAPYLLLDLAGAARSFFGGVSLRLEQEGRVADLLPVVREPGRYLVDLREALPGLRGRQAEATLEVVLRGAAVELPGPATVVRELACLARPPARVEVMSPGGSPPRLDDLVAMEVELAAPADVVTARLETPDLPSRTIRWGGGETLALRPVDATRRVWAVGRRAEAGDDLPAAGHLLARVEVDGQPLAVRVVPYESAGETGQPDVAPEPPVIDGLLADPAWDWAEVLPLATGQARVLRESDALYLAAVLPPGVESLPVTVRPGGGAVYRFEARPEQPTASRVDDPAWEAHWQSTLAQDERGRIAELALPWWLFEPGEDRWRVEVAGAVTEVAAPPRDYAVGTGPLEVGGLTLDGQLQAWLTLPVVNQTGEPLTLRGVARLQRLDEPASDAATETSLSPGERTALRWRIPLPAPGTYRLGWQLSDGDILRRGERRVIEVESRPLQVRLVQPSYRHAIYFTQDLDEAVVEVTAPSYLPDGVELVASLLLGDVPLDQQTFPPPGERFEVRFPVKGLPEEAYRLQVTARLDHEVLGADEVPLRKLPLGPASEVRVDADGRVLANVAPLLPIIGPGGIELLDRPEPDADGPWFVQPLAEFLTAAPALDESGRAKLDELLAAVRDHPRLFGYWLGDDETLSGFEPRYLRDVYRHLSTADPYHPVLGPNPSVADLPVADGVAPDDGRPWLVRVPADRLWPALATAPAGIWVTGDVPPDLLPAARRALAGAPIERNGPAQLVVLGGRTMTGWTLVVGNPTAEEVTGRFELGVAADEPVPVLGEDRAVEVRYELTDTWAPGGWHVYSTEPALRPVREPAELLLPAGGDAAAITDGGPAGWRVPAEPPRLVWTWPAPRPVSGFEITWRGGGRYRVEGRVEGEWRLLDEVDPPADGPRATRFLPQPMDALRLIPEPPASGVAELEEWRVWTDAPPE